MTREPGGSPKAEQIRAVHPERTRQAARARSPRRCCSRRGAHRPSRDRRSGPLSTEGMHVLCDRFADSTRAYQGAVGQVDRRLARRARAGRRRRHAAGPDVHPRPSRGGRPRPRPQPAAAKGEGRPVRGGGDRLPRGSAPGFLRHRRARVRSAARSSTPTGTRTRSRRRSGRSCASACPELDQNPPRETADVA